ncbi:hypothetical protein EXS74_00690 [Candidatus Woesearchaeota archaeon]|nr:hypothetical protein [Candidatus Woesearchaeota archaeon]
MEARGKIYEPFIGRPVNREDIALLERLLQDGNFNLWTTTEYPTRRMISFGGRDSLDNDRCLQGYSEIERGPGNSQRYQLYARGSTLITFLDNLDLKEL